MKGFAPRRQLSKIPNRNETSNEQFTLRESKISLDEITKSINFQA